MRYIGRKFVPQSTIDRRVQEKDDRMNAELAAFRNRTSNAALFPKSPPAVVEVALVPDPENNAIVSEPAIVPVYDLKSVTSSHIPEGNYPRFRKPSKLDRAIVKKIARLLDAKWLRRWAAEVKARDRWCDRMTGVRLRRCLELDPLRAEAHHVVSKTDSAVRYDVRNGICLSLLTHDAVERGLFRIEGTAWFQVDGVTYIDATAPVTFVRT